MARADLMCELIKYGLLNDNLNFRKAAEALCAEERAKQHTILANKIQDLLSIEKKQAIERNSSANIVRGGMNESSLFWEKVPQKRMENLILPQAVKDICQSMIDEQLRADILQSYGLEPRNKVLLIGPPGNGKTSLAEAMAEALMVPLLTVRYESIVGAYLGETASKLSKLFEIAKTRKCVLFFDEFETLGKERGDAHETGEIKRVVSSLLMQIDALPSYVVAIAATNHDTLLDKAASLPNNITLDFVSHDKELFRLIYGIAAEKEEEIKHRKYPEYGKTPQSGDFITKKIFQEAEDIRTIKNKNEYAVIIENGINFYEALQNRQDACIKINVLYNLETWCSFNQESFSKIQKLKKAGGLNEFDMPVMPKDNAQLEEFMSLLLE